MARRSRRATSTVARQAARWAGGTQGARAGLAVTDDTRYCKLFRVSRTAHVRLLLALALASRPSNKASRTRRMRATAAAGGGGGRSRWEAGSWAVEGGGARAVMCVARWWDGDGGGVRGVRVYDGTRGG